MIFLFFYELYNNKSNNNLTVKYSKTWGLFIFHNNRCKTFRCNTIISNLKQNE